MQHFVSLWDSQNYVDYFFKLLKVRSVHSAVQYNFDPFLSPHYTVWFSQNHHITTSQFYGHMYYAIRFDTVLVYNSVIWSVLG